MVGTTGIEPVTPAMSRQCSTAELRAPNNDPGKIAPGARKIPYAPCVSQPGNDDLAYEEHICPQITQITQIKEQDRLRAGSELLIRL